MDRSGPLVSLAAGLLARRRWLLLALLALLHLVLLQGPENPLGRTIFVGHIGLFFLWQPFVQAEQRLSMPVLGTVLGVLVLFTASLNWWLLGVWLMLLAGIIGGKVLLFEARWTRLSYLLALTYLVAALFLVVLPAAVPTMRLDEVISKVSRWSLPAILAISALLPSQRESGEQTEVVDFVYSVFVFLLLAVLSLGSLALMLLLGRSYVEALLDTLLAIGSVLLFLGWIWNPRAGFGGIGTAFSRYMLSIGLPVERWLHTLADLAERQDSPDRFVADACTEMAHRLPWVTGGTWSTGTGKGTFGRTEGLESQFRYGDFQLNIHTRYSLSPSLIWHFNLLAQLVGEFHADKLRAQQLKVLTHVRVVHETGARLTHDIKNLLQSLRTLCAAGGDGGDAIQPQYVALLRRQLPLVTQRLSHTLEKLQAPRKEEIDSLIPASTWWLNLQKRYGGDRITFVAVGETSGCVVPEPLFSSTAENLLENALNKRRSSGELDIEIVLDLKGTAPTLSVADNGKAVPDPLAGELTRGPVTSENGFGIGLYQVARLAEMNGYELSLADNCAGRVVFRLNARSG